MFNSLTLKEIEANRVVVDQMLLLSRTKLAQDNNDYNNYNKKVLLFWEKRKKELQSNKQSYILGL